MQRWVQEGKEKKWIHTAKDKMVQAKVESEEEKKRSVTNSLIVMVAGMKTQIAIMQETFGIYDEDTKFQAMFQKVAGAKRTREGDELSSAGVPAAARPECKWPIAHATEEETRELQQLWAIAKVQVEGGQDLTEEVD